MEKYLVEFEYKIEDIVSSEFYQVFQFGGFDKRHIGTFMIPLPLILRNTTGNEEIITAQVYVTDAYAAFLCWKKTIE